MAATFSSHATVGIFTEEMDDCRGHANIKQRSARVRAHLEMVQHARVHFHDGERCVFFDFRGFMNHAIVKQLLHQVMVTSRRRSDTKPVCESVGQTRDSDRFFCDIRQ